MIGRFLKFTSIFFILILLLAGGAFFWLSDDAENSYGSRPETVRFTVAKGEGIVSLGKRLKEMEIVKSDWAFILYALKTGKYRTLQAGDYALNGTETIDEIIEKISQGKVVPPGTRVTFPEGWTLDQMAGRLTENNLAGKDFLAIASKPFPKWKEKYAFLSSLPVGQSLEGYLFPDTYIFPEQATGELIVDELLENFGKKVTSEMIGRAKAKKMTLHELLTLASIVEAEVNTPSDRKLVADIFLRRLSVGQALQSDATLRYAIGNSPKVKYSTEETKTDSPYNTYLYPGLPPGPINNPSVEAIEAVLTPTPNEFFYFLNNSETGQTVFSKTFDEHVLKKGQNGL